MSRLPEDPLARSYSVQILCSGKIVRLRYTGYSVGACHIPCLANAARQAGLVFSSSARHQHVQEKTKPYQFNGMPGMRQNDAMHETSNVHLSQVGLQPEIVTKTVLPSDRRSVFPTGSLQSTDWNVSTGSTGSWCRP